MTVPGVNNCGSHIGQALAADEAVGVNFGENWISVDLLVGFPAPMGITWACGPQLWVRVLSTSPVPQAGPQPRRFFSHFPAGQNPIPPTYDTFLGIVATGTCGTLEAYRAGVPSDARLSGT
jgi:hypothetical protein